MNKLPEQFSIPHTWESARAILTHREASTARLINYMRDGFLSQIRKITASETMNSADSVVLIDATAGAVVYTLQPASKCQEKRLAVKLIDSSGNGMTVTAAGSDKIDGAATYASTTQYNSVDIVCDGVNWYKI